MRLHPSCHPALHRSLLRTFLIASGLLGGTVLGSSCAAHYDNFQDEYMALTCDLSAACNPSYTCTSTGDFFHEKGECTRYRPTKANRCIRQLEDFLEQVEAEAEDSQLCTDRPWTNIPECDEATEPKMGPTC